MNLLVLSGGFGTRLKTVVSELPKSLAPVGGKPFLHYQIKNWSNQGIRSFVFLLHHQADLIIDFLDNEGRKLFIGAEMRYLVEPMPMGTGGAVAYALEKLDIKGDFLVTNADTWIEAGIAEVMNAITPAMAVVEVPDAARYGSVQLKENRYVKVFEEKQCSQNYGGWINAGICRFNAKFFQDWDRLPFSLEQVTLPRLASDGVLRAITLRTNFIDIGIPKDYLRFCRWVESGMLGKL